MKFRTAPFPNWRSNTGLWVRQFYHEIGVRILFVDVSQVVQEQSEVKVARRHHICSYILLASCTQTRVEFLTVTSPAGEIFTNASSKPLVLYFIYLIGGPVSYSYEGQFRAVKLAFYRRAV